MYADPFKLNVATLANTFLATLGDTTTNSQGDFYPDSVAVTFDGPLPDLVSDQNRNSSERI